MILQFDPDNPKRNVRNLSTRRTEVDLRSAIILLPQTVLRLWGVSGSSKMCFRQAHLPLRLPNDRLFEQPYYEINKMLISMISNSEPIPINLNNSNLINENSVLTDSHILNLSSHFAGVKIQNPNVLSYASDGYSSLLLSDLQFPKHFMRGVIRSKRLWQKFEPNLIIHWDDYAQRKQSELINFGWMHNFVDSKKIIELSRKFLVKYLEHFLEIKDYELSFETIIIYPPVHLDLEKIQELLKKKIFENSEFAELFKSSHQILIKQHKFCTVDLPQKFTFFNKEIRVAKSFKLRVLPIEILLLGFHKVTFLTVPTSSIFAGDFNFKKIMWGQDIRELSLGYELMLKRHKI